MEQRGVDVGGIVKDVVDERQYQQDLQLGRAFDCQTRADVACPMQQDGKDGERGRDARQIVRDLRIGRGKCSDTHPVTKLAAQVGAGEAQCRKKRTQTVAHAQVDDKRQVYDERIRLTGKQFSANGIGDREGGTGCGANPQQFKRMAPIDFDAAQRRRGKNAKEQRRGVVNRPKNHFDLRRHQRLPPSKRTAK